MGLQGFINKGFYSKITGVSVDVDNLYVAFTLRTYDKKGGVEAFNPVEFRLGFEEEVRKYVEEHTVAFVPVEYPKVCLDREKLVPMWPDGVDQNVVNEYNNTRIKYLEDCEKQIAAEEKVVKELRSEAERLNVYTQFFDKSKLFGVSNPLACAYKYIKSLPGFTGVNDDTE